MSEAQAQGPPGAVTPELHWEIEQFLRAEARMLDNREFEQWLDLFSDDVHYYMPGRAHTYEDQTRDGFNAGFEGAHFDEDKERLILRVRKLRTGRDHAERPHSMIRHHVTNVYVEARPSADAYEARSYFLVTRLRHGRFKDVYSGERVDEVRRADSPFGWQISRREITLDETTLLGGGIGFFF